MKSLWSLVLISGLAVAQTPQPRSGIAVRSAADSALVLTRRVEHLDTVAMEPMVAELADGRLFVAGYGGPSGTAGVRAFWRTRLWQSADRGATWSRVNPGADSASAIGNSDVDLAVAPDGTLYFASMLFDAGSGEGRRIAVGATRDAGATWSWTVLAQDRFDDRPWVAVAPDGRAHAIWNDGSGVSHAVSRDGGAHWTTLGHVHGRGGSSHLAVGPAGEVAVRLVPISASGNRFDPDVDLVAVSTDGGMTWEKHPAPGQRVWVPVSEWRSVARGLRPATPGAVPRWVEPLAWDGAGRLYSLWTDTAGVWLARSADRGGTWATWRVVRSDQPCYYPYLIARGRGELAASWRCGRATALALHVARIDVSDGAAPPRVREAPPIPIERGEVRALGEYVAVRFLRDGAVGVVTPAVRETGGGFTWWRFETRAQAPKP